MLKKKTLIFLILWLTVSFTACTKSRQEVIKCESVKNETTVIDSKTSYNEKFITEKLPKEYKSSMAINNGVYYIVKGYNLDNYPLIYVAKNNQ